MLVGVVLVAAVLVFAVNLFSRGNAGFNADVSTSTQP